MENEVLVSSDASGQTWNCCIWDYCTGTNLRTCKGGVSAYRTLALMGTDYLVSAEPGRPIINVWPLFRKDQSHLKIVSPGRVSVLTVTPDGTFCIAAVGEKFYIWQISTGELLLAISHHYQNITCLKTTDDGGFLISAGEDSLVFVWKLGKRLQAAINASFTTTTHCTPHYTWTHHSLPVTDLHIGKGGRKAKVVTVSLDHTCRVYSLRNGELLLTIVMEVSLLSVAMDLAEFFIFAGGSDGRIFQVNLFEPPSTSEYHVSSGNDPRSTFQGHIKAVTCLAVSIDCNVLISGSDDQSVKIWNIPSRQCLHSLSHKGPITNVILIPALQSIISSMPTRSKINVQPFCSYLCGSDNLEGTWEHTACVTLPPASQLDHSSVVFKDAKRLVQNETLEVRNLILQVDELQRLNDELYTKAVDELIDS